MTQTFHDQGRRLGILSVDEGTTGTRAGVVLDSGTVAHVAYRTIAVRHPDENSVEQDPTEIWTTTLDVCREALAWARANNVEIAALALSTQRATAMLWDRRTGLPLVPACVWQDRRYARHLLAYEDEWDDVLTARTGRPVGSRAPFYWAARQIAEVPAVAAAYEAGTLVFGTVDTWLAWKFTGGAAHAISASSAGSAGAYLLREHAWDREWVEQLGFPLELLPDLFADDDHGYGSTDPALLGVALPLAAVMGDQHAALIALGGLSAGQGMCVYGTGTFVDAATGNTPVLPVPGVTGVLAQPGWRQGDTTHFSLEAYCSTTGSALRWLCDDLKFFASPTEIGELAKQAGPGGHEWFVPALAGIRTPAWRPQATAALSGLTLATTRADIARAVLDGIAHSVCDLIDGVAETMRAPFRQLRVGGGVTGSDTLMQLQADIVGLPLERAADSATASLRGTAYLAGVREGLWSSLEEVVEAQPRGHVFEPTTTAEQRGEQRKAWQAVLAPHLH
ncbi:FGGY-family carbohydrate kinase [Streptomyces sp. SID3343]|uniref:FGGY family carbohydrate kinase n=1 Tax=Streptomyces sp. SID3343 TaxID=2690260 RepID=UPI00136EBE27|nr:FGGY-family carbohydrate kinase [Streptomyces sp. SID3343]MYW06473.1 carbohydrate kinase [Streptomyces sp. SID3343]